MNFSLWREKCYYRYMIYLLTLIVEIIVLFLLSRFMSKSLSGFMSLNFLSLIFLPGIIIHELSHVFVASILFVPVGDMEFVPKRVGDSAKLGSVEIGKTDPIRRALIGFAPVLVGLLIVIGGVYLASVNLSFFQDMNPYLYVGAILLIAYLLFAISNTMFSSSRDMEGTVEILVALLIVFTAAYILGFRISLTFLDKIFIQEIVSVIQKSTFFLLVPIILDILILGAINTVRKLKT